MADVAANSHSRKAAKAATRARVLQSAKAAFEHVGYEAATIRLIARSAGLSTGAVFSSFLDKRALYSAVYGHEPVTQEAARALIAEVEQLRHQLAGSPKAPPRMDEEIARQRELVGPAFHFRTDDDGSVVELEDVA